MIQSFAELKRELQKYRKIKLVEAPCMPNHKYLNVVREIVKVQTNGIQLEGGSWLGLGMYGEKSSDFTYQENGFTVYNNNEYSLGKKDYLRYEFVR